MRALGCLPLFILCLVLSPATDAEMKTGEEMKKEMEAFQGEWRLTGLETDGEQRDVPDGEGARIVFKGDRLLLGGEEKFTIKIDPTCNPKIIDLIPIEKENKEDVLEGIYRFRGNKLTLCLRGPLRIRMRPLTFGEDNSMVVTLERSSQ